MSGFEDEAGYEEPYESYEEPAEEFDPDGTGERELGAVELAGYQVELEQEASRQVYPGDYEPLSGLTFEAEAYQGDAQFAARQEIGRQDYEAALVDRVAELGKEREYSITSPQAIREAAGQVDGLRRQLFAQCLAEGFDVSQSGAAVDEFTERAIRQALEHQRFRELTSHGSLGEWRRGQEAAARKAALAGEPPPPSVYDSPSWQRMAAASQRYVEREQKRRDTWSQYFRNQGIR